MELNGAKNRERILKACQRNPSASVDEIATAAKVSKVTVFKHLKALKQAGEIEHKFIPRGRGKAKTATGKSKKTAEQRRIDRIVRRAKRREQRNGGRDVVIDYGIRSVSFRATKVG